MTASSVAAVESLSQLTSSRSTIVCTDPATGERIGEAPVMSPDEVRETVRRKDVDVQPLEPDPKRNRPNAPF